MIKKTKTLTKKELHKGYLSLYQYDLEVPSLTPDEHPILLTERKIVLTHDSVLILIYVPTLNSFVFCQQFRLGVFVNAAGDNPFILECVAGTIDKNEHPEETARREVFEETGMRVKTLKPIAMAYKSPGIISEKMHLFYAEIDTKPTKGIYGVEDEEILTHIITREKVYALMDEMKINDIATLLALNWFRANNKALSIV